MSTSRKDPVSCDVIIDQWFHVKAVYSKAVKIKTWFFTLFKKGAVLIAFVAFKYIFKKKLNAVKYPFPVFP